MEELKLYTEDKRIVRPEEIEGAHDEWPEFIHHSEGDPGGKNYEKLGSLFPQFQFHLRDNQDVSVGGGISIPLKWDGSVEDLPEGWHAAIARGIENHGNAETPTALCALAAQIGAAHAGKGYSKHLVRAMKTLAANHNLGWVILPLRPTLKHHYPLASMERYIQWKRTDGQPFDPWLRVHLREGGEILCIDPKVMIFRAPISDWEEWTKMKFPESGEYVVPGALQVVVIDREKGIGYHEEPNVWVKHDIS